MTRNPLIFFAAWLTSAAAIFGDSVWKDVPVSRNSGPLNGIEIPQALSEGSITFVGGAIAAVPSSSATRRIVAIDIFGSADQTPETPPPPNLPVETVPFGAHWPDEHGLIDEEPGEQGNAMGGSSVRNPWELRVFPGDSRIAVVFVCEGVIIGGSGGSVAILNGRIVRRGDTVGEFEVANVLTLGVVLETNGSYLVIPRGRSTTVATVRG